MASEEMRGRFSEALAQLQSLHDGQVAFLTAEVVRLRAELESNRLVAEVPLHCSDGTGRDSPSHRSNASDSAAPAGQLRQEFEYLAVVPSWQGTGEGNVLQSPSTRSQASKSSRPRLSSASQIGSTGEGNVLPSPSARSQASKSSRPRLASTSQIGRNKKAIGNAPLVEAGWRGRCEQLVQRPAFDGCIGLLIALNAVCIGIESSIARAGHKPPVAFTATEYCFVAVYIVELAVHLVVKGIKALFDPWIRFDLFLVSCGVLDVVTKVVNSESVWILEKVLLVRILRLARLARVFRMMTKFNTLWLLVQGLMNSFSSQIWTGAMMGILLYVFSVIGLEVLRPDLEASKEYAEIIDKHFSSLPAAMLTLLQGLTMDSFSSIYRPIMLENPYSALYFVPFLLTVPIALMNLVTAIMVNYSLDQAAKDKEAREQELEERREALADLLNDMFRDLDTNNSGRIDMVEMMNAPKEVHSLIFEIAEISMQESDRRQLLQEIFDTLDFDGSGDIDIGEFCGGLTKMQNRNALDSMRLQKQCQKMMDKMTNLLTAASKDSGGIQSV